MKLTVKIKIFIFILSICSCGKNNIVDKSDENNDITYKWLLYDSIYSKDSTQFKKLTYLNIAHSEIKNNSDFILSDSLIKLDISYSSYIDTLMHIKKMNSLEVAYFLNNKFGVVVDDTLSVRKLSISYNNNEEMDKYYSYIDVNKLPKLESLSVHCKRCEVQIPKKKLKMLSIQTNKIDTFYKDTSLVHHSILEK